MTWWDIAFLPAVGVVGGLSGSIAGLASIATYPALLVVGLPPVTANVTNTVAMVFTAVGSVWGSRPELKGQGPWLKRILPVAAVAGAIGAALLLSTPAEGFEKLVPILLGGASIAIAIPVGVVENSEWQVTGGTPSPCCSSQPRFLRSASTAAISVPPRACC
jgi:uncharacterized protein